jgi:hypothetical protein
LPLFFDESYLLFDVQDLMQIKQAFKGHVLQIAETTKASYDWPVDKKINTM